MIIGTRMAAGLSQKAYADLVGVSPATLGRIERAQVAGEEISVNETTWEALCRVIGAGAERVLWGLSTTNIGKPAGGYGVAGRPSKALPDICSSCRCELPLTGECDSYSCS